mmetsp:Transcript_49401/g.49778  ORF Transcript_49401/g.49778 Transcript_49401/m.49778 type:complete len:178 (-) Transcript_49401:576-1109(-)
MKRQRAFRSLGRLPKHKFAMLRNMVTSLIKHERIETTLPKAKEMKKLAENMVTHAKKGTLHRRRLAARFVREKPMVVKLFEILGPRYQDRDGGYTRILKLSKRRLGDNAPMAIIEYVDRPGEVRAARPPQKRKEAQNLKEVLQSVGIQPLTNSEVDAMTNDVGEPMEIDEVSKDPLK